MPPESKPASPASTVEPRMTNGHGGRGRGPVQKPARFGETLKRLWSDLREARGKLGLVFLFILASSAITLVGPYLIGVAVDAMRGGAGTVSLRLIHAVVIGLIAAYVGDAILNYGQGWIMAGLSQRAVRGLRGALFAKLHKLPLSYFDARRHGEVMSRLSNDLDNVSTSISQSTAQLMSGIIAIIGSLVMMLVLSPLLTLASLITVPLVFVLARTVTKRTGRMFKQQQEYLGRLNGHVEESVTGLLVVHAFNREKKAIAEFDEVNASLREIGVRAQIWSGLLMPLLSVINNIGFTTVAVVGGLLALKGSISVGVIASFISYSRQFARPLNDLANVYNVLLSGVAGAERVYELMDEQEEPDDAEGSIVLTGPVGRVDFEGVSFGYDPARPILRDIRFSAEPGARIAFVGPTGAGKTTIVQLLTRFYDVTEGRILINGHDIRSYTRDSLRRAFGVVLQDAYLFSGTIGDNIRYGRPDATEAEMREAASMANADSFIRRMPRGYETMLTENGGNLSQGQRQLLSIARVMLAKPSILILDEATSSIDTRTELQIQAALLKVMQGRTSFIIAHRLNTIQSADEILVIADGHIAERGPHDELIERDGLYRRMFMSQSGEAEST